MTTHDLFRTVEGCGIERAADDGHPSRLTVTFARFNRFNEIRSHEGHFLERLAPGAFAATFAERGPQGTGMIRALFQHGRDPSIGDKPLGRVVEVAETERGPTGVVELLDRPYVADIAAGVDAGVYGASYRFGVHADDESWVWSPERSADNPDKLPERTIHAVSVAEFGPVTFPADEATGAAGMVGVRSLDAMFSPIAEPAVSVSVSADLEPGAAETDTDLMAAATLHAERARLWAIGEAARRH